MLTYQTLWSFTPVTALHIILSFFLSHATSPLNKLFVFTLISLVMSFVIETSPKKLFLLAQLAILYVFLSIKMTSFWIYLFLPAGSNPVILPTLFFIASPANPATWLPRLNPMMWTWSGVKLFTCNHVIYLRQSKVTNLRWPTMYFTRWLTFALKMTDLCFKADRPVLWRWLTKG